MSSSKFIMAKKLCNVQKRLMAAEITDVSLEVLLPLIFKECLKEKLTFWFNFLEDAVVLNLRDTEHENYELNIRNIYENVPLSGKEIDNLKINVLLNAFLITSKPHTFDDASSAPRKEVKQKAVPMTDAVPPTSVRTVMEMLEKEGKPVNRKTIQEHLQFDKMSTDNRNRCIAYLKTMPMEE